MFYIGIVENNNDPLKLGRLQVRIYGVHTFNREDVELNYLPTEKLPWAMPIFPISNSCIDGISDFTGIVKGTKVIICFMDSYQQMPFYIGVLPFALDKEVDFSNGFTDPNSVHPNSDFINESSISRLARNENIDKTYVKQRNDNRTSWSDGQEPESAYNAQYPYNRVFETESGIVIELDSTPNNVRINIWHPSGYYTEIDNNGSKTEKTVGTNIEINNDKTVIVKGNYKTEVDGEVNIKTSGIKINTDGDIEVTTSGNITLNATRISLN